MLGLKLSHVSKEAPVNANGVHNQTKAMDRKWRFLFGKKKFRCQYALQNYIYFWSMLEMCTYLPESCIARG